MQRLSLFIAAAAAPLLIIATTASDRPQCVPTEPGAPVCAEASCGGMDMPALACADGTERVCECQDSDSAFGAACGWNCWCQGEDSVVPPGYVGTCPDIEACGPRPLMPNHVCADGETWAGPTGRCLQVDTGALDVLRCEWEIVECPADFPCDPHYCEGAEAPAVACPAMVGIELVCDCAAPTADADQCGWTNCRCVDTRQACEPRECGPAPLMPCYLDADGSVCGCATDCVRDAATGRCGWQVPACDATGRE